MAQIDLNCDLGEGGAHDAELLALVTSANIACGGHAGDPTTMALTITKARALKVRVGAHPGYFDRGNFGRVELALSSNQLFSECVYQIGALRALARCFDYDVAYIKPHGALYNQAFRDPEVALMVKAAANFFQLPLLTLPNSQLRDYEGSIYRFIHEGFADRRYRSDGSLIPRSEPNAFVEDPNEAADQAERLILEQNIRSLCVHGDNPDAVEFVRKLRERLTARGHEICPFA